MTPDDTPNDEGAAPPGEPGPQRHRRLDDIRAHGVRIYRRVRSRRGLIAVLVLVAGIGSIVTIGGFASLKYTETVGFCSRCHTMAPEVGAYKPSVHREVPCAECHVSPGIGGWIKAKKNGTKQMIEIIVGKYPRPIPPPNHAKLPAVKDTCMKCHSLSAITKNGGPMKVILRPSYQEDKSNTRQMTAVVVRAANLGAKNGTRSAHWHVEQKVEYTTSDEHSQKIDSVHVTFNNGTQKQFIARSKIGISVNVKQDIARLSRTETTRRMDCIECHNRVGHDIPTPDKAIDDSIAAGKISPGLPFIKRLGLSRVSGNYPSVEAADKAIGDIQNTYATKYPLIAKTRQRTVTKAIDELKLIYRLVATPEMKATAATYPNNLGHQSSPGCFRCHDGAHFRVVKGRVTKETIPWACTTCHTFPQVGKTITSVSLLGEPATHKATLWVFNHKNKVASLDPAGTTCAACHRRSYCQNCHSSGAAKVSHDVMLYQHPTAAAKSGTNACAYCHQPASCARCHRNPVLGSKTSYAHRKKD